MFLFKTIWVVLGRFRAKKKDVRNRREKDQTVELLRVLENDFEVSWPVGSKGPPNTWNEVRKYFTQVPVL